MGKKNYISLKDLKVNPNNPRLIKDDKFKKLVKSIREFPKMMELRPIVINADSMVLGGNMRHRALLELKYTDIPNDWVKRAEDLTEDEARRFIIADNVGFGEHDWDVLASEWDVDELNDWGLETPDDWGDKLEAKEDDYEIPSEIETEIVLGDLFEIGEHRLVCGDSTKADTFSRLFGGRMADMVLTDPPYNVDYTGKTKDAMKIENDKKNDSDFYQFLYDFYSSQSTVCKDGGAWYVWHADSEGANFRKAMADSGVMVKQCLIWVKNSMVMGRQDYHWQHEPCLYGWKKGAAHGWYSDRKQTTILNFDRPNRNASHPTMKPIPLFSYQIGNSSKQGDIIADGFGGSGTTMVACHQMNRKAYVVEYDPKYCQVIIDRMKALDGDLIIKKNGEVYDAL
jgi:site-specific DNA-methyltransferase (adenine-specific)